MKHPPWQVFISYTSELDRFPSDNSFVQAAKGGIRRAGHEIVEMGGFPASELPPAKLCAELLANCDIYIAIIGFRYGALVRDKLDVSYTEFEFDMAGSLGLPRLVFVLDELAAVPAALFFDLEYGSRQAYFRRKVQDEAGLTIKRIQRAPELENGVFQSLIFKGAHAGKHQRLPRDIRAGSRILPFYFVVDSSRSMTGAMLNAANNMILIRT